LRGQLPHGVHDTADITLAAATRRSGDLNRNGFVEQAVRVQQRAAGMKLDMILERPAEPLRAIEGGDPEARFRQRSRDRQNIQHATHGLSIRSHISPKWRQHVPTGMTAQARHGRASSHGRRLFHTLYSPKAG
jgi:hypothetical protein